MALQALFLLSFGFQEVENEELCLFLKINFSCPSIMTTCLTFLCVSVLAHKDSICMVAFSRDNTFQVTIKEEELFSLFCSES